MLTIEYLGHSAFLIDSKEGRFLLDPFDDIGYDLPKVKADYVSISHGHCDHCNAMAVRRAKEVFTDPYVYQGGLVEGLSTFHDEAGGTLRGTNTVFKFRLDGLTVCHMGDIGEPPRGEILSFLKDVDILMIPVGGVYTVTAQGAKAYIDAVQPRIVIPMHYNDPESNIRIHPLENFLRLFPAERVVYADGKYQPSDIDGVQAERTAQAESLAQKEGCPKIVVLPRRK